MNVLEKCSIWLRHRPLLKNASWLWDRVRPWYDRLICALSPRGVKRLMNGTDEIRLLPELRGVVEEYEPDVWRIVMGAMRPGAVVIDVGAHVGFYAIAMAKRVGPQGRVWAAEPDPVNQVMLHQHIALNGVSAQVQVIPAGISDQKGTAILHQQGLQSQLLAAGMTTPGVTVNLTTIDAVIEDAAVDLILVDVEGFELPVLRGASALLGSSTRRPGIMVIEVHPYAWAESGTTSAGLLGWLSQHGYVVTDPHGRPVTEITTYGHVIARLA